VCFILAEAAIQDVFGESKGQQTHSAVIWHQCVYFILAEAAKQDVFGESKGQQTHGAVIWHQVRVYHLS